MSLEQSMHLMSTNGSLSVSYNRYDPDAVFWIDTKGRATRWGI